MEVNGYGLIFYGLGGFFIILIIIYMILRFGCGKCVGPTTMKEINRSFRNITWVLVVLALCGFVGVYAAILTFNIQLK